MYGAGDFIGTLVWVFILVVGVMFAARIMGLGGPRHVRRMRDMWGGSSALDILKERFAKGEINKEEYEERKKVLMEDSK